MITFHGVFTAMVTPFARGGVDYQRLEANVKFQLAGGVDGLVPMGTTGESPTLSHDEHMEFTENVVQLVRELSGRRKGKRRAIVIAGTGSNATSEAVELTRHAKECGADAVLSVNPYYNKPTQEGLYRHFMAVADSADIPVVLYNIPGRCAVALTPQTIARLAKHPNIAAVKEATGSLDVASEVVQLCDPRKFTVVSGDDSLTLPLMSVGAKGVVSVVSNLLPAKVAAMVGAANNGDYKKALALHLALFPVCKAMFIETNPIPIKTAMMLAGMDSGEFRLPMCEMGAANRKAMEAELRKHHALKK